jgi:hypothetical protein
LQIDTEVVRVVFNHLGRAVLGNCYFEAGETIAEIRGTIVEDPDYSSDYCFDLDKGRSLEPSSPFRFLNHSCEPNCEIFMWEHELDQQDALLLIGARQAIEPGHELTIDYAWPATSAIPCLCNVESCRGWIVAKEELGDLRRPTNPSG